MDVPLARGPRRTTRLLERGRGVAGRGLPEKLGFGPYLVEPIGFVMSKKMLWTIKKPNAPPTKRHQRPRGGWQLETPRGVRERSVVHEPGAAGATRVGAISVR